MIATRIDHDRFNELMQKSERKVYNLAYRLSMNKQDAEDLTQEAFVRAYRNFNDYEGDRPFENWIFRIVTRLFLDLKRARRRRIQPTSLDAPIRHGSDEITLDVADQGPNAEGIMLESALSEDLECALNQLKEEQRMLVLLADVEQLPYNEIAESMQIPVGTVRSRLHRAHKKLRETLTAIKESRAAKPRRPLTLTNKCVSCNCS
jgi:RNA polymerase sigma-70 factor, ECF subfamily